ncbi:MAG: FAD-binding protein [bacterium]
MLDLQERAELSTVDDEHFSEWMKAVRNFDVLIIGADAAGLTAGIVLQWEGINTLVVDEAEQTGGRLLWDVGPVPIVSPVDELIEELGFPVDDNPPLWLDRFEILNCLQNKFIEKGGRVVPGIVVDEFPTLEKSTFKTELSFQQRSEVLEAEDVIVSMPGQPVVHSSEDDAKDPLEEIVLSTLRRNEEWIQAGFQCIEPDKRDMEYPFVNALIMSGWKAGEIVLNDW